MLQKTDASGCGLDSGGFGFERAAAAAAQAPVVRVADPPAVVALPKIHRVVLEMSPKPFPDMREASLRQVCREVFRQWSPLVRQADAAAVMLWTADGSEILEYRDTWTTKSNGPVTSATPTPGKRCRTIRKKSPAQRGVSLSRESAGDDVRGPGEDRQDAQGGRPGDDRQAGLRRGHLRSRRRVCPLAVQVSETQRDLPGQHDGQGKLRLLLRHLERRPRALRGLSQRIPQGTPLGPSWPAVPAFSHRPGVRLRVVLQRFWLRYGNLENDRAVVRREAVRRTPAGEIRDKILQFWKCFRASVRTSQSRRAARIWPWASIWLPTPCRCARSTAATSIFQPRRTPLGPR